MRTAIIAALSALLASVAGADIPQGDGTRYLADSTVRQWEACAWRSNTPEGSGLSLKRPIFVYDMPRTKKHTVLHANVLVDNTVCFGFVVSEVPFAQDEVVWKLKNASPSELRSPKFLQEVKKAFGVYDAVWACGIESIDGRNAVWTISPMTRMLGGGNVAYRGVQKSYVFWERGNKFVMASYMIGVLGAYNHPIDDFRAVAEIGEKFIKSIRVKSKWKFW